MPASNTPRKNLVVMKPAQLLTRPWHMVTRPNMNMQKLNQTCGFNLLSMMLLGISKMM